MCPNCVAWQREDDGPPSYEAWLHSIIDTAVRKAVEIVETEGALATPSPPQSHHQELALAKDSGERRYVRAKIHALLLQWSNMHQGTDNHREWRTMVSQAVPLLEEALYQQAPTLEDYSNPLLLEPHLRRILCLFHAGHGLPLLQGPYTHHSCVDQDNTSTTVAATPIWLDDASLEWERSTLRAQGTIASLLASEMCSSRKEEANRALWNAIASGDHSLLKHALSYHGDFASSRVVKRAYELISTQKGAGGDFHQEPQTERKEKGGSVDVKKPPHTEKKRCRKTLRDVLRIHDQHKPSSEVPACVRSEADDALMHDPSSSSTANSSHEGSVMKKYMQEPSAPSSSSPPLNSDHPTQTCNASEQSTQNNNVDVALPEGEHEASSMIQEERGAATTTGTVPSRTTAMQQGERKALITSTPSRTSRAPLITFLAEEEDFALPSHIQTSWDKWEEPAEAMDPLCCVCMVGLKGAAFIPCGHTYCRKCSRELFRSRMTCPLCNQGVTSILDIY